MHKIIHIQPLNIPYFINTEKGGHKTIIISLNVEGGKHFVLSEYTVFPVLGSVFFVEKSPSEKSPCLNPGIFSPDSIHGCKNRHGTNIDNLKK